MRDLQLLPINQGKPSFWNSFWNILLNVNPFANELRYESGFTHGHFDYFIQGYCTNRSFSGNSLFTE